MLYMIVETYHPGAAPAIYRRARDRGRLLPPGVEFVDRERAPALARECNDYAAAVVQEHSGRFGAFAVLSVSDVEQARAFGLILLDEHLLVLLYQRMRQFVVAAADGVAHQEAVLGRQQVVGR